MICGTEFWINNEPSFDRINSELPHTLSNIVLTCSICNRRRGSRSLEEVQLEVEILKFAKEHDLPTTINNEKVINLVRRGVTGVKFCCS
jgi:hypothetical protein